MATRQDKVKQLARDVINKMMEIAGHKERYDDLIGRENWFSEMTMTSDQHDKWQEWVVKESRSRIGLTKEAAQNEFMWVDLMYGLKIEQNETTN